MLISVSCLPTICLETVNSVARSAGQCADICEASASECDKFDMDMSKQFAKVCRTSDEECRKMSRSYS